MKGRERNTKAPRHKGKRGKEEERKKPLEPLLLLTTDSREACMPPRHEAPQPRGLAYY
jgi:hypothetical protein